MDENKVNALIAVVRPAEGDDGDVWADIGGLYEQKAFQRRIDALTDPTTYATGRATTLGLIKAASVTAYKTAHAGYIKAGLSPELAKENATNSAKSEYHNQQNVFNLQYGQGTDQIFQGATAQAGPVAAVRNAMGGGAAPRRRAPARRAPASRTTAQRSAAAKKGAATKRRNAKKK